MKKSSENKQIQSLFRPYVEVLSNFSDTELVEKKRQGSNEQNLNWTASTSRNCECDDVNLQFGNTKFNFSNSEISINFGSFDEESFGGDIGRKDSVGAAEIFSRALDSVDCNVGASAEVIQTRGCFFEDFLKSSELDTVMEQSSSDLLLRKTTKITNFKFVAYDQDRLPEAADPKCAAEVLVAKSTLNRLEKSNNHEDENKMVALSDVSAVPILRKELLRTERNSAISELRDSPGQSQAYMETDEDQMYLGNKSDFYNERTVNFFLKKRGKTSQRSKFTQKRVKFNEGDKSAAAGKRIFDSGVSLKKDLEIKQYLLDFYIYIIFLIFITTIALFMVSSNMFYFTDVTVALFFDTPSAPNKTENVSRSARLKIDHNYSAPIGKTLKESNTREDFWAFAESTMIDMFYWNFYYSKIDPLIHTAKDDRKMLYENEILGVPRMRQVRVRNDSCKIHPNIQRFFQNCYYYYSVFSEETRPIKEGMENTSTATAWVYKKAKELKTTFYWGEISIYGGGGYYLDFDIHKNKTAQMINELKTNHWVSRATRAIFIDFNLYNANVNLFLICKIVLEFPPVGGMLPREDFHALKLIRYLTVLDFFILACEFVVVLFSLYFTYKQIVTCISLRFSFFAFWWNYIDVFILILLYTYIILSVVRYIYTEELISQLQVNYFKYTEFSTVKDLQIIYNNVIAVLVFLCWVKLFAYLNFTVSMVEFRKTLSRSLKDILGFFPMFLTMFVAFAVLAYLLFGNQIKDYDSVWSSFLALLQAFLGEFEYDEIQKSNQILGPIFYVTFIFFIFFVLLNVFIAIINDAYASVKSEVISDPPKTGEYVKRGFSNLFSWCNCRKKKRFKKKSSVRRELLYEDIKKMLANAGFSENEINIFFAKYDINVNNLADEDTRKKIVENLELQRIDFTENSEQFEIGVLRRQIDNLSAWIEEIEMNLQVILDKVDILLSRR